MTGSNILERDDETYDFCINGTTMTQEQLLAGNVSAVGRFTKKKASVLRSALIMGRSVARVEKTVFISYRRTTVAWALAIWQNLTHNGFDVFFDYQGIASGDFERVILENIRGRAHFIVLLTPSALERSDDPADWLRREIEVALDSRRNVVPVTLEGFDFGTPSIAKYLVGSLAALRRYNALPVPPEYFPAAMDRLREKYLNVPLDAVMHPTSSEAKLAVAIQKYAAGAAPAVEAPELTAEKWFERGFAATDPDEQIRLYSEAIRLKSDFAPAYNNRGYARAAKRDLEEAMKDYNEAIRLQPDFVGAYNNRGIVRKMKGDLDGAVNDYNEAIRLEPGYARAYNNRGNARDAKGDLEEAVNDYSEAIRLKPDYSEAYYNRGITRKQNGDLEGAVKDYNEAIQLKPDYADAYYNRGLVQELKAENAAAVADFQKYLDLGGGVRDGDQAQVENRIRRLKKAR